MLLFYRSLFFLNGGRFYLHQNMPRNIQNKNNHPYQILKFHINPQRHIYVLPPAGLAFDRPKATPKLGKMAATDETEKEKALTEGKQFAASLVEELADQDG